jgi:AmpE protein
MKLLALLIAFAISHFISKPERFRNFNWLSKLNQWVIKNKFFESKDINMLVVLFIPIFIIHVFSQWFFDSSLGSFIISIVVLIYCIGPKSLEEQFSKAVGYESNEAPKKTISLITRLSLHRWFGVFFWYVVLGIVGALLYRFSERLCEQNNNSEYSDTYAKLLQILNYPVAWMMVLALAIASDFERVYKKCSPYMSMRNIKSIDDRFLYEAMDFAVENCETDENHEISLEQTSLNVLKRMLIVCLVFVSVLVILAI